LGIQEFEAVKSCILIKVCKEFST